MYGGIFFLEKQKNRKEKKKEKRHGKRKSIQTNTKCTSFTFAISFFFLRENQYKKPFPPPTPHTAFSG